MPQVAVAWVAAEVFANAVPYLILNGFSTLAAQSIAFAAAASTAVVGTKLTTRTPSIPTQERKQTLRAPAATRRVIYGEVRAGGVLVYAGTDGKDNSYASLVIAVAHGELDGYDPVFWLNDTLSTDDRFSGLVQAYFYTGTDTQAACPELLADRPTDWTADHKLSGIAYVYLRLKYSSDAFPQGLPSASFLARGRRVFDPRTGVTAWSANPPLCILDYLRADFGLRCPDHLIDFDSFAAAANVCDELVPSIDPMNAVDGVGNLVRRYTLNGVIDLAGAPASIIEQMQSSCAGRLVFSQGKYRFYTGAFDQPHPLTLTGEFLRADPSIRTKPGRTELFNTVRGTYVEPKQLWVETDYAEQVDEAALAADNGDEIVQDLSFPFTTNAAIAQRLGRLALNKARGAATMQLQCNWAALAYRLWDVVPIDLPEINVTGQTFRIVEYKFAEGGGIDLSLARERAEDYAWSTIQERLVAEVVTPDFNTSIDPVHDLVVSGAPRVEQYGTVPLLSATWSPSESAFVDTYLVEWKESSASQWVQSRSTTGLRIDITEVAFDTTYDLRVTVLATDRRRSEAVTETGVLVLNDTTAPGVPTALSVTGSGTHTISWRTPANDDFKKSNVYANTTMTDVGAVMVASIVGLPETVYAAIHTPSATPRYYYVSSVDRTGNESPLTYAGTGT